MIEFRSVSHRYGDRPTLQDVTLRLVERRIGVIGPNGSGKSTLARLCNGLVKPTSGTVLAEGHDTTRETAAVRRVTGFVFQDPDTQILMPTVAEDLAFSLRPLRLPAAEVARRVDAQLEAFGLVDHRDHPAHLLSGGQKQLLAIAAVLMTDPAIVLFDEPTTLLDLRNKHRVMETIVGLSQQIVVVTHDLDLLDRFDRVILIDEGRVAADGAPGETVAFYRKLILG
ncbi:MAG: energy-coupling factor ABC transporter ATP-binding protein [Propionibacteriaceae bacterium]|nr:energy-coupling factor ABC transporter ATP-binding protein [Propionibacteriaceae bacterium]